jgi:hypothetical protein
MFVVIIVVGLAAVVASIGLVVAAGNLRRIRNH